MGLRADQHALPDNRVADGRQNCVRDRAKETQLCGVEADPQSRPHAEGGAVAGRLVRHEIVADEQSVAIYFDNAAL